MFNRLNLLRNQSRCEEHLADMKYGKDTSRSIMHHYESQTAALWGPSERSHDGPYKYNVLFSNNDNGPYYNKLKPLVWAFEGDVPVSRPNYATPELTYPFDQWPNHDVELPVIAPGTINWEKTAFFSPVVERSD